MNAPRPILVVEDDRKISQLLCDYFASAGYSPVAMHDGAQALANFRAVAPAAVILDLGLPGLDGLKVCQSIRGHSDVPILMVTARVDEIDRLLGLETGADDYICKPFSPREVVARTAALIRRAEGRLVAGQARPWRVDEAARRIEWGGQNLAVTPIEFRLLATLLERPGRVFGRAQLLDAVHADFRDVSDRAIDSHIKNIRRKLAAAGADPGCLVSVYGAGYRFDPPSPD